MNPTRAVNPAAALVEILEDRTDVRLAYLFGSAARDRERSASDLDVAVLFEPVPAGRDIDGLATRLEAAAGRQVDLVVPGTAPPLLAHEVIATGRLLVCRDEDERARFELRVISRYLDSARLRRVQHAYLRELADAHRAVRPDVVRRKLLDITESIGRLRSWLPVTQERLQQDVMLRWAIEHGLHLAAEALFDAGNHVPSAEFQEFAVGHWLAGAGR